MHRLLTFLSFVVVSFALVMLSLATVALPVTLAEPVHRPVAQLGQINTPTAVLTETLTPEPTDNPTDTPTPTPGVSPTVTPTLTPTLTPTVTLTDTPTPDVTSEPTTTAQTAQESEAGEPQSTPEATAVLTDTADAPLEGTIIANRSANDARFFVEGVTYDLAPERSLGLSLPRATSVLNLYNCDAGTPESETTCFWDPYLVTLEGFYEIYNAPDTEVAARLLLREAGSPPTDQVWVQNRTAETEQVVYRNDIYDIAPTTVREFPVAADVPAIFYVRSCVTLSGQTVCEWAPKTLDAGVYYAMVAIDTAGSTPGSQITTLDLRPVVAGVELTPTPQATPAAETGTPSQPQTETPAAVAAAGQLTCRLLVPTLNVRSGPGLLYEIIDKIRSGDEPATAVVDGRSVDGEWLTVVSVAVEDGWITASSNFITCDGDLMSLPIVEAPAPPPTPDPSWVIEEPTPDASTTIPQVPVEGAPETPADQSAAEETASDEQPAIPPGQALLLVNNGFDYDIRFTLDQRYRPNLGPSEYDLQPGDSVAIVTFPGQVDFSASSPWSGLSGNASLHLEPDQSITLWVRFEPDPGDPDRWILAWQ